MFQHIFHTLIKLKYLFSCTHGSYDISHNEWTPPSNVQFDNAWRGIVAEMPSEISTSIYNTAHNSAINISLTRAPSWHQAPDPAAFSRQQLLATLCLDQLFLRYVR